MAGFFIVATAEKQQKKQVKSDEEKEPNYGAWVLGVFVALVLYALSIGPAILVASKVGGDNERFFVTAYAPLIWLHSNTPLKEPLGAYVRLWERWGR